MSQSWQYPVFLIRHGGGYAAIVDPPGGEDATQSLVVCQQKEDAVQFMMQCGIMGALSELNNDREFSWLLQCLKAPVVNVVFNPSGEANDAPDVTQRMTVNELLTEQLVVDNSPWSYPVYVIAQDDRFASIRGPDRDGRETTAVGFFADVERTKAYLDAAGETGTACPLKDLQEARTFLAGLASQVPAVAWNPTVSDGQRVAKHCFSIQTLLRKYLVTDGDSMHRSGD